jgi:hypothetical protein
MDTDQHEENGINRFLAKAPSRNGTATTASRKDAKGAKEQQKRGISKRSQPRPTC